jgi:hypothetical protein
MASDTEQRSDAPTQASPSRPPDWSTVKQWRQHTRHGDTEALSCKRISGALVEVLCRQLREAIDEADRRAAFGGRYVGWPHVNKTILETPSLVYARSSHVESACEAGRPSIGLITYVANYLVISVSSMLRADVKPLSHSLPLPVRAGRRADRPLQERSAQAALAPAPSCARSDSLLLTRVRR